MASLSRRPPRYLLAWPLPHQPDVRHVVTPVPGVEGEDVVEAQRTRVVGMTQGARPVVRAERAQQQDPPPVDGVEEVEGDVDRRPRVGQLGPSGLVVSADRRHVLGQGELAAHVGVEMAVGQVG